MTDTTEATATPSLDRPTEGRDARGRFQPGCSGNPAGKKPGTLNHATRLKQMVGEADFDTVADHLLAAARDGHGPSVRFVMERLVPKGRGRPITLDLPAGASRRARGAAIVDGMCAGEITPDEAKLMLTVMARAAAIPEEAPIADAVADMAADTAPVARAHGDATAPAAGDLHFTCISPPATPVASPSRRRPAADARAAMAA